MAAKRKTVSDEDLLTMNRSGKTVRGIEAALKRRGTPLGRSSIDERLKRLAAAGAQVRGKSKRSRTAPLDLVTPPAEGDDVDATRARLRRIRQMLDANEAAALAGEVSMSTWAGLARLEADLVDRVISQIPPETPRPEDDPTNREEASAFL